MRITAALPTLLSIVLAAAAPLAIGPQSGFPGFLNPFAAAAPVINNTPILNLLPSAGAASQAAALPLAVAAPAAVAAPQQLNEPHVHAAPNLDLGGLLGALPINEARPEAAVHNRRSVARLRRDTDRLTARQEPYGYFRGKNYAKTPASVETIPAALIETAEINVIPALFAVPGVATNEVAPNAKAVLSAALKGLQQ